MADFVYLVVVIGGFFALMVGLVLGCDRIVRSGDQSGGTAGEAS